MDPVIALAAGFGVSFLVLDVARAVGAGHFPSHRESPWENFRPYAIFLALFAGPALFVRAVVKMKASSNLGIFDAVLACVIACIWASAYGILVSQGVRQAGALIN